MTRIDSKLLVLAFTALAAGAAQGDEDDRDRARARLSGFQEVPAVSTAAKASFEAKLTPTGFGYELSYHGLENDAAQSHIHFGQKSVNGGVSVFLCSNLGNGPAGTQACPLRAGTIRGAISVGDVIGPGVQGITAGQLDELLRAMRAGITYVNVHTTGFPGGEVRGQIKVDD